MTPDRRHSQRGPERAGAGRDAERLINRLLDGELSREQSQELLREMRDDARACEELARARICVERLREPIAAPDLSEAILSRVHARRRFVPRRGRRLVTVGRVAIAAGLVGAAALASFVQRHAPGVRLADDPAPVSRFVEATAPGADDQAGLNQAVESLQASLAAPVRGLKLSPNFRPESGLHFDLSLERGAGSVAPTYTFIPRGYAASGPLRLDAGRFDPAQAEQAAPANPEAQFITRFESLLVILRQPPSAIDDQPDEE